VPARLINIKYITIRAEKVASPVTALQCATLWCPVCIELLQLFSRFSFGGPHPVWTIVGDPTWTEARQSSCFHHAIPKSAQCRYRQAAGARLYQYSRRRVPFYAKPRSRNTAALPDRLMCKIGLYTFRITSRISSTFFRPIIYTHSSNIVKTHP